MALASSEIALKAPSGVEKASPTRLRESLGQPSTEQKKTADFLRTEKGKGLKPLQVLRNFVERQIATTKERLSKNNSTPLPKELVLVTLKDIPTDKLIELLGAFNRIQATLPPDYSWRKSDVKPQGVAKSQDDEKPQDRSDVKPKEEPDTEPQGVIKSQDDDK